MIQGDRFRPMALLSAVVSSLFAVSNYGVQGPREEAKRPSEVGYRGRDLLCGELGRPVRPSNQRLVLPSEWLTKAPRRA